MLSYKKEKMTCMKYAKVFENAAIFQLCKYSLFWDFHRLQIWLSLSFAVFVQMNTIKKTEPAPMASIHTHREKKLWSATRFSCASSIYSTHWQNGYS